VTVYSVGFIDSWAIHRRISTALSSTIATGELKKMWNEAIVASFNSPSQDFRGVVTEEIHEMPQSVVCLRAENRTRDLQHTKQTY